MYFVVLVRSLDSLNSHCQGFCSSKDPICCACSQLLRPPFQGLREAHPAQVIKIDLSASPPPPPPLGEQGHTQESMKRPGAGGGGGLTNGSNLLCAVYVTLHHKTTQKSPDGWIFLVLKRPYSERGDSKL